MLHFDPYKGPPNISFLWYKKNINREMIRQSNLYFEKYKTHGVAFYFFQNLWRHDWEWAFSVERFCPACFIITTQIANTIYCKKIWYVLLLWCTLAAPNYCLKNDSIDGTDRGRLLRPERMVSMLYSYCSVVNE